MAEFSTLVRGLSFTECPRWRGERLYVSDRYTHSVLALAVNGTAETFARISGLPCGLGFLPDGRMLITSMLDRKILRREPDGSLVEHTDLSALAPWQLNDMLVDHDGRAWVGNFGFDLMGGAPARTTALICVMPDGTARVASEPTRLPKRHGAYGGPPHTHRGRNHDEPSKRIQRHGRLVERAQDMGRIWRTSKIDRRCRDSRTSGSRA